MAVDCPRFEVTTGVSVSVVSAVAVGEVAGICAGPDCSVSHAAAAMSRSAARMRFRIGDSSRFHCSTTLARPPVERSPSSRSRTRNSGQRR